MVAMQGYFLDPATPDHVVVTFPGGGGDGQAPAFWRTHNATLSYPKGNRFWNPVLASGAVKIARGRGLDGGVALDLGCGGNRVDAHLRREFGVEQVVGLDFDAGCGADVCSSALSLPFSSKTFTLAWCYGLLPYVPNVQGLLGEVSRVLAPGGLAVLYAEYVSLGRWGTACLNALLGRGVPAEGVGTHLAVVLSSLVEEAQRVGLRCLGAEPDERGVWEQGTLLGVEWRSPVNAVAVFEKV